jgi:adenine-specific DNA-methyltransferase
LSVKYAAEVRRYLLEKFSSVRIVLFEELVFPGVQEEVVLLLAEGRGPAPFFEVYHATSLRSLLDINRADWVPFAPEHEDKWLRALVSQESLGILDGVKREATFESLLDWGDTYLGIVTGNNRYFTFSRADARTLGIPDRELLPISPPGSRHLRGLTFSSKAWDSLMKEGRACYLFYPPASVPSSNAEKYIAAGETLGVHKAYKCRVRTPWWRVPLVAAPDLFLTYMDRDRPRLLSNRAGVHVLNSLYGVRLKKDRKAAGQDLLPLAALNSATMLSAELIGRSYGGGMLKLEPREADKLALPSFQLLENVGNELRAMRPQLSGLLRKGALADACRIVDRIVLTGGCGLTYDAIEEVRKAREILFGRRNTRSKAQTAD